jgi:hypothetical protein
MTDRQSTERRKAARRQVAGGEAEEQHLREESTARRTPADIRWHRRRAGRRDRLVVAMNQRNRSGLADAWRREGGRGVSSPPRSGVWSSISTIRRHAHSTGTTAPGVQPDLLTGLAYPQTANWGAFRNAIRPDHRP